VSKLKSSANPTEWLDEFLASGDGEKVIVFAEHVDFVERLADRYGNIAVKIRGGVSNEDRMAAVDRFQNDPTCRVFIGNMAAASEGLTLTAASDVVFCELAWTPSIHEQCVGRCYGRVNDLHGATAWYLLARNTIDEDICRLLSRRRRL
jgi:SWI/SNF-related matrix-associated actin-dependent regulator 1 of chromatin subfamily A